MLRMLAIILFIALFPGVALAIALGIFVHPLFFLILILVILALPAALALLRRSRPQGAWRAMRHGGPQPVIQPRRTPGRSRQGAGRRVCCSTACASIRFRGALLPLRKARR